MARYLSSGKKSRDKSTFNPPSFSKVQTYALQYDPKNAHILKLQSLESNLKYVNERIQLLEKKNIMAEGSFERDKSTYWQHMMQESIRCESPCELMVLGQSEVVKGSRMSDIDLGHGRIELVENSTKKFIVSNESLENERIAFWKDVLMEDSMPECNSGAFLDSELDIFTVNPQVGNCDGGANYINFAEFGDLGMELMQNYPLSSDFDAQEEFQLFY